MNFNGADIQREIDIALPPNFQVYSKQDKKEKYTIMMPRRLGQNNPKVTSSFESKMIDLNKLRMPRIEKRSLNIPDEEEFNNIEFELQKRKQEAAVMSERNKFLKSQHQELVKNSINPGWSFEFSGLKLYTFRGFIFILSYKGASYSLEIDTLLNVTQYVKS